MESVDYSAILEGVADLVGVPVDALQASDGEMIRRRVSHHLGRIWRAHWWTFLTPAEARQYRPSWSGATTYAAGAEVYGETTGKYHRSLQAANLNHAVTDGTWWEEATDLDRCIAYEQAGQTVISQVRGVYDRDPRRYMNALELAWDTTPTGLQVFTPGVALPWVQFRQPAPRLTGRLFDAAATYAAAQQVYWVDAAGAGNFWDALAATAAAQSPGTHPDKWARVKLPALWQEYLECGAAADWLQGDGQLEKAAAERNRLVTVLGEAIVADGPGRLSLVGTR